LICSHGADGDAFSWDTHVLEQNDEIIWEKEIRKRATDYEIAKKENTDLLCPIV
jgi:hypothetical protein